MARSKHNRTLPDDLARCIDHTLLKPDATQAQIVQLCAEARAHHFASVCVNPVYVKLCAHLLKGSDVETCTVVGFPLGANTTVVKACETREVVALGATEVDMVINIGALKSANYEAVLDDIVVVTQAAHEGGALVKVIIEAALLTDEEKVIACQLAQAAGAEFVKTSTGFASGGATVADVTLMRQTVGPEMGVKAAGGIRTFQDAQAMIGAGASRLGASAGIAILAEATNL
ncbi:MAG: deoxyribose-phosphate aldolase [Chloroflexota bacterium]